MRFVSSTQKNNKNAYQTHGSVGVLVILSVFYIMLPVGEGE